MAMLAFVWCVLLPWNKNPSLLFTVMVFGVQGRSPWLDTVMNKHALLVGVDTYESDRGLTSLLFAQDDARKLGDLLETSFEFNVRQLLGPEATKAALEESLTAGVLNGQRLEANDLFLFYFAGHGTTTHFSGQYYLHCHGATLEHAACSLPVGWLVQFLHSRDFSPRQILLILDACRNVPPVYQGRRGTEEATDGACLRRDIVTAQREGTVDGPVHTVGVLYGCEPHGISQEDPEELKQGVLAYHLMESLRSDEVQTLSDWVDRACERCVEWTQEQSRHRRGQICVQRPWPEGTNYLRKVALRQTGPLHISLRGRVEAMEQPVLAIETVSDYLGQLGGMYRIESSDTLDELERRQSAELVETLRELEQLDKENRSNDHA